MKKDFKMAGMDREGGAFFANSRKQNEKQPDYRGEIRLSPEVVRELVKQMENGVQFPMIELSGWKKTSNNGTTYISMIGKKPYKPNEPQPRNAPSDWNGGGKSGGWTPPKGMPDDEIPFAPEWR